MLAKDLVKHYYCQMQFYNIKNKPKVNQLTLFFFKKATSIENFSSELQTWKMKDNLGTVKEQVQLEVNEELEGNSK